MAEVEMVVQEIERVALSIGIPPCPGILLELTEETKNNEPDFSKVEKLLSRDVALSAILIKTINSPFYGLRTKISSVSQAVGLMGIPMVTSAISNLVLRNVFADIKDHINMERYWDSSAKLALSTMHLAKKIPGLNKDDAYTYGLFQNCGVPVLIQRFPDYKETLHKANNLSEGKFTTVEDEAHGTDHATVSYLMTKSWNLPEVTTSAIQFHHEYDMLSDSQTKLHSDSKSLIALGLLADHAIHLSSGLNKNFSHEWTKGGALALAQLDLSYSDFADICEDIAHLIE
jgi:HD-like signal output (HDOD) protein